MESMEEIAGLVRAELVRLGWSPRQLAAAAHVSRPLVLGPLLAAGGQVPRADVLARLALACGREWDFFGAAVPADVPAGEPTRLAAARLARGWARETLAHAAAVPVHVARYAEEGKLADRGQWARLWAAVRAKS